MLLSAPEKKLKCIYYGCAVTPKVEEIASLTGNRHHDDDTISYEYKNLYMYYLLVNLSNNKICINQPSHGK